METNINTTDFTIPNADALTNVLHEHGQYKLTDLVTKLTDVAGKKSFLVFKHNKYFAVAVKNIAFFHIRFESSLIVCMDGKEYPVNYSLDQIQHLVTGKQFFRVNRQSLVNFSAINEVEHYFARKLLINLSIATTEKLLVPKEKVRSFLYWMENR